MQSVREETLEKWYTIKLCFKLGKNATEMYGMLQTAFGASCLNQASVFEWHRRFKEVRESVRDGERCGRSKEVRTLDLIDQIKNFMDKDCRASIETTTKQFDVSVGTVYIIIREELKMQKICSKGDQKERRCHDSREMVELINSDPTVFDTLWAAMKAGSTAMTQRPRDRVPSGSMLALPNPRRPDRANPPTNFWWSLFLTALEWSTSTWVPTELTVNKEYYVEILREFRKRFRQKRPALFKSCLWQFYQGNAQVHNSILVTDYLTKMSINTVPQPPYSPDLAPCEF